MREIKLRAWDKKTKRMYWVESLDWTRDAGGLFYIGIQESDTVRREAITGFELMQYTGLKDKNGKEIYEGDIVKWSEKSEALGGINEYLYEARMHNFCWILWSIDDAENEYLDLASEGEVIGNIYENPELLKEDK